MDPTNLNEAVKMTKREEMLFHPKSYPVKLRPCSWATTCMSATKTMDPMSLNEAVKMTKREEMLFYPKSYPAKLRPCSWATTCRP